MNLRQLICVNYIYLIILLTGCGDNNQSNQKVFHHNYSLESVANIILEESEGNYLGKCRGIRVDDNGCIYYGDASQVSVKVFHPDGRLKYSFGQQGKAPYELDDINAFDIQNNRAVFCKSGHTISIFDTCGKYINYFRVADGSAPIGNSVNINPLNNNILLASCSLAGGGNFSKLYKDSWIISEYDSTGKFIKHFGKYCNYILENELFHFRLVGFPIIHVDKKSRIYYCTDYIPIIQIYDSKGNQINEISVQSDLFIPIINFKDSKQKRKVSFIWYICYLEEPNVLLIVFCNRHNETNNIQYHINIYDFNNNTLVPDIDITNIIKPNEILAHFCTDGRECIYILTDNTPDQVTITKFKITKKGDIVLK